MSEILALLKDHEIRHYDAGENLLEFGKRAGVLLVLKSGTVEVTKNDVQIAVCSDPGAVFGEISVLMDSGHSATVRALTPTDAYVIEDAENYMREHPEFHMHVTRLLALRLGQLVAYLADVKQQFRDHDHIGMVDVVLDKLLHRQPRDLKRPIPADDIDVDG